MPACNPLDLTDRAFLVTGASSGIGRATAILLSRLGARVAATGRDSERLRLTLEQMTAGAHHTCSLDLTSEPVDEAVSRIVDALGPLTGIAHCAGVHSLKPLKLWTRDSIRDMIDVNVIVAFELAKAFRKPARHAAGASLVFLSSVMGSVSQPGASVYSASKAAVEGLTRSLALELAREGMRVNCVAPAVVRTEMAERSLNTLTAPQLERFRTAHPLGFGTAEDVAGAVAFLLADTGRWITGTTLFVDGGYTAH